MENGQLLREGDDGRKATIEPDNPTEGL